MNSAESLRTIPFLQSDGEKNEAIYTRVEHSSHEKLFRPGHQYGYIFADKTILYAPVRTHPDLDSIFTTSLPQYAPQEAHSRFYYSREIQENTTHISLNLTAQNLPAFEETFRFFRYHLLSTPYPTEANFFGAVYEPRVQYDGPLFRFDIKGFEEGIGTMGKNIYSPELQNQEYSILFHPTTRVLSSGKTHEAAAWKMGYRKEDDVPCWAIRVVDTSLEQGNILHLVERKGTMVFTQSLIQDFIQALFDHNEPGSTILKICLLGGKKTEIPLENLYQNLHSGR